MQIILFKNIYLKIKLLEKLFLVNSLFFRGSYSISTFVGYLMSNQFLYK